MEFPNTSKIAKSEIKTKKLLPYIVVRIKKSTKYCGY